MTNFNGTGINYNTIGCPTKYQGKSLTWVKGKLTGMSSGTFATGTRSYSFVYNAQGQRVTSSYKFLEGTSSLTPIETGEAIEYTKSYRYDHFGRLHSESTTQTLYGIGSDTTKIEYLYDESGVVGFKYTYAGVTTPYYYRRNLQGDVIEIYDTGNSRVVRYDYDAWGNCTIASGTTNQIIARANPIRYRGYYYDVETELYYLNARYYSPIWRRFISPDDTAYLDSESVNGLNLYAYCNNDPVNYADPSGHSVVLTLALIGLGIGVAVGLAYATYTDIKDDGDFNGSVGWQNYVGSAIIGGALGFGLGYFWPTFSAFWGSSYTFALPSLEALNMGGALSLAGSVTVTVTGAQIVGGAIAAGVGIVLFAKPSTGPIRFSDGTGIDPSTGKPVTEKGRAYEIYRSLDDIKKKLNWKTWMKSKGWRINHLK